MKCVSGPLTPAQVLEELPEIVNLLRLGGIEELLVEFGSGCKLEAQRLWQDTVVGLADLAAFIQRSIEEGIYSPGRADLILQDRDRSFECLFCHESDIHLETEDVSMIEKVNKRWMDKGYKGFKMAAAGEDWEPI